VPTVLLQDNVLLGQGAGNALIATLNYISPPRPTALLGQVRKLLDFCADIIFCKSLMVTLHVISGFIFELRTKIDITRGCILAEFEALYLTIPLEYASA
jgi:hypothetical protein